MLADVFLFSCSGNSSCVCTPEERLKCFYKETSFMYMSSTYYEIFAGKLFLYYDLRVPA